MNQKLEYTNRAKKVLQKYGNIPIDQIQIIRAPIPKGISKAVELITQGKSKSIYDTLFHLAIICVLQDGSVIGVEKNENIVIDDNYKMNEHNEMIKIIIRNKTITLDSMLNKALEAMGDRKFFEYESLENNCQTFIAQLLKNSGLLTTQIENFIYQDMTELIKEVPTFVRKLAGLATKGYAVFQDLLGAGNGEDEDNDDDGTPGVITNTSVIEDKNASLSGGKSHPNLYYGINNVPTGKKQASMKQAARDNQVKFYGKFKVDKLLLDSMKEQSELKKLEDENDKLKIKIVGFNGKLRKASEYIQYAKTQKEKEKNESQFQKLKKEQREFMDKRNELEKIIKKRKGIEDSKNEVINVKKEVINDKKELISEKKDIEKIDHLENLAKILANVVEQLKNDKKKRLLTKKIQVN